MAENSGLPIGGPKYDVRVFGKKAWPQTIQAVYCIESAIGVGIGPETGTVSEQLDTVHAPVAETTASSGYIQEVGTTLPVPGTITVSVPTGTGEYEWQPYVTYWYHPYVKEYYPIWYHMWLDSTRIGEAFSLAKKLIDKKYVKVKTVKRFVEFVNLLAGAM